MTTDPAPWPPELTDELEFLLRRPIGTLDRVTLTLRVAIDDLLGWLADGRIFQGLHKRPWRSVREDFQAASTIPGAVQVGDEMFRLADELPTPHATPSKASTGTSKTALMRTWRTRADAAYARLRPSVARRGRHCRRSQHPQDQNLLRPDARPRLRAQDGTNS
jgi:hypothetical protein